MDRNWIRHRGLTAALLAAGLLGVPALAEAQLLPNLPTRKRERPPCETEPPYFKAVRHQYYGYFPTCWRTFPKGWGCPCPNPEAPILGGTPTGPSGAQPPAERDLSVDPPSNPNANPNPGANPARPPAGPDVTTPPLPKERDLFSNPDDPPANLPAPPANPPAGPPPSADLGADPFGDILAGAPNTRPSPALLDPGSPSTPPTPNPNIETLPPLPIAAQPVAAPTAPRRSVLAGLFNRMRR